MKNLVFMLIMLLIYSCSYHDKDKTEENIINDVFLKVVDTVAYKYHSLRPPLPSNLNNTDTLDDKIIANANSKLFIILADTLLNLNNWKKEIDFYFDEHKELGKYKEMIKKKNIDDRKNIFINTSTITNTGKFKLISANQKIAEDGILCGSVTFSRVVYDKALTNAAFLIKIYAGPKAGLTKLVLLTKKKEWVIQKEEIFEVW